MNYKQFIFDINRKLDLLKIVDVNAEKRKKLEETFYRLDRLIDNATDSKERISYVA